MHGAGESSEEGREMKCQSRSIIIIINLIAKQYGDQIITAYVFNVRRRVVVVLSMVVDHLYTRSPDKAQLSIVVVRQCSVCV